VWAQQAYVTASNTGANEEFGLSVALPGDATIMVVDAKVEVSAATGVDGDQIDDSRFAAGAV
jgi:hypothetical protein